jgi:hypothetical protein
MKGEIFTDLQHKLIIQQDHKNSYQKYVILIFVHFETRSPVCMHDLSGKKLGYYTSMA